MIKYKVIYLLTIILLITACGGGGGSNSTSGTNKNTASEDNNPGTNNNNSTNYNIDFWEYLIPSTSRSVTFQSYEKANDIWQLSSDNEKNNWIIPSPSEANLTQFFSFDLEDSEQINYYKENNDIKIHWVNDNTSFRVTTYKRFLAHNFVTKYLDERIKTFGPYSNGSFTFTTNHGSINKNIDQYIINVSMDSDNDVYIDYYEKGGGVAFTYIHYNCPANTPLDPNYPYEEFCSNASLDLADIEFDHPNLEEKPLINLWSYLLPSNNSVSAYDTYWIENNNIDLVSSHEEAWQVYENRAYQDGVENTTTYESDETSIFIELNSNYKYNLPQHITSEEAYKNSKDHFFKVFGPFNEYSFSIKDIYRTDNDVIVMIEKIEDFDSALIVINYYAKAKGLVGFYVYENCPLGISIHLNQDYASACDAGYLSQILTPHSSTPTVEENPFHGFWGNTGSENVTLKGAGSQLTFHAIPYSASPSGWYNALSKGLISIGDPFIKDIVPIRDNLWSALVRFKSGSSITGVTEVSWLETQLTFSHDKKTLIINASGSSATLAKQE